ncbi:MAG: SpoIIE family protein phosphatase [Bacteroidales bacterium]
MDKKENLFIEIAHHHENKHGKVVCGDTFLSRKISGDNRYVAVLSDGLGSGIKASVLSTMTASMAMNFRLRREPVLRSALNIMNALPIDSVRNINYATFTIVDTDFEGMTQILEFDSPDYLLFRDQEKTTPIRKAIGIDREGQQYTAYLGDTEAMKKLGNEAAKFRIMYRSALKLCKGDRIIFYSDGVVQSGMGAAEHPFGWGKEAVEEFVQEVLKNRPEISARDLSRLIVNSALQKDGMKSKDDISCAVIYARNPRKLLLCSGPPYDNKNDKLLSNTVASYKGKKVICGGTTSKIVARELHRELCVDLKNIKAREYPPEATMEGVDLVTEGILTLGLVAEMLEKENPLEEHANSPAADIIRLIQVSDIIDLFVGTRINEAHQDPSLPVELEIRRNVVKRISQLLEDKWLKKVNVSFI